MFLRILNRPVNQIYYVSGVILFNLYDSALTYVYVILEAEENQVTDPNGAAHGNDIPFR